MHFLGAGAAARSLKSQNTNIQVTWFKILKKSLETTNIFFPVFIKNF